MVNAGDLGWEGWYLGWEDLLEEGMATHYTTEQLTTAHIYIYIFGEKVKTKAERFPNLRIF